MKRLLIVFFCLLSIYSCRKDSRHLSQHELTGKVKKATIVSYEAIVRFGDVAKGRRSDSVEILFDDKGKYISSAMDNQYSGLRVYKEGMLGDKPCMHEYNNYGILESTTIFEPNRQTPIKSIVVNNSKDTIEVRKHEYSNNGRDGNVKTYGIDGRFKNTILFREDVSGRTIYVEYRDSLDSPKYSCEYLYKKGLREKEVKWSSCDKIPDTITYKSIVDGKGNWIERIAYRENEPFSIEIRTIEYY